MPDLLDIAPKEDRVGTVMVLDKEIEIRPIKVGDLAKIARRFPELRKALFREGVPEDIKAAALLEAWPAICAAGTGHAEDPKHEAAANRLPQGELIRLGSAIMALSGPREEEPSADPLPDSAAIIAAAQTTAGTSSRRRSRG